MKLSVDEVDTPNKNNIAIRFAGNGVNFQASDYGISVYIDEQTADSVAFHLQSILQDRERKRKESA